LPVLCDAGLALELLWHLLQNDCVWQLAAQLALTAALCVFDQSVALCDAGRVFAPLWQLLQNVWLWQPV
jgi:hypothetical protein